MRLCVVRHGVAVARQAGVEDAGRALTPDGIARTRAAMTGLSTLLSPDVVFTSPLRRARQTASIATEVFGLPRAVDCEPLANGQHAALLAALREADASVAALVGHEPWLSSLVSMLVGCSGGPLRVQIKKAGAALVEMPDSLEPGAGTLAWLLPPTVLRRLGAN